MFLPLLVSLYQKTTKQYRFFYQFNNSDAVFTFLFLAPVLQLKKNLWTFDALMRVASFRTHFGISV